MKIKNPSLRFTKIISIPSSNNVASLWNMSNMPWRKKIWNLRHPSMLLFKCNFSRTLKVLYKKFRTAHIRSGTIKYVPEWKYPFQNGNNRPGTEIRIFKKKTEKMVMLYFSEYRFLGFFSSLPHCFFSVYLFFPEAWIFHKSVEHCV